MLTVIAGDGLTANDAAWAVIVDVAERALMLPGVSAECASGLRRFQAASLRCAGLPARHDHATAAVTTTRFYKTPRSVVVAAPTDRAAHRAEDEQHDAHHQQNRTDRVENGDLRDDGNDQKDHSKKDQ